MSKEIEFPPEFGEGDDPRFRPVTLLWEQLERAWAQGFSVQLSPLLSGEAEWHGQVAIYFQGPDPRDTEPKRGRVYKLSELAEGLRKGLDWIEARKP